MGAVIEELDVRLDGMVMSLAREVLFDIVRLEYDELRARNPSFADLAEQCKRIIIDLAPLMKNEVVRKKVHGNFIELMEILESIALSIVDINEKLMNDNVTHLQEFLKINGARRV